MEKRDYDMTVALLDRHIKKWRERAERNSFADIPRYHQCTTAQDALESLRSDFVNANS